MLTEHEQLADHEARISRQELPPLQQPLDNIEGIRQALNNEWQPFGTAPEGVQLLWCFTYGTRYADYFVQDQNYIGRLLTAYAEKSLLNNFSGCYWKHLPPPPKDNNV